MITPQFEVRQNEEFVFIDIKAPYIKASLIQFEVSEDVFVFTLPPYYLRLRFPGHVIEDDRMTSSYDLSTSLIHCRVSKLHKGEHFEDLDMISKLLATKRQQEAQKSAKPVIQDLDADPAAIQQAMEDPDFDFEIEQKIPDDSRSTALGTTVKYGFNNQYTERIGMSMHTGNEINELADPEHETADAKLRLMRETTAEQFDREHYYADFHDREVIDELLHYKMPTAILLEDSYKDRVTRLGNREFFIDNLKSTYLGILPLVFSWAYDYRSNWGEHTVESSWTIGKLCPSMCFLFNSYQTVHDVVVDCTARSLMRPLYRNWDLTMRVWQDTMTVLKGGRRNILGVFSRLLEVFEHDLNGVYRQILIEDYTIWIQHSSERVIEKLGLELEKVILNNFRQDVYLPLQETEAGDLKNSDEDQEEQGDSDDESGTEM